MLWVLAFHIISMVAWFAGLFYLPRLYVYHAVATDEISKDRFKVMERRLFYGIMTPSGILTTIFGVWLLSYNWSGYLAAGWMHAKLALVVLLWVYHLLCGKFMIDFKHNNNRRSQMFYRIFNEVPTILLIVIVLLVVIKP